MRLTIVLLIIGLHIQARGLSQERVTLNVKDASLESVLKAISKQTGYQYALQDQWKGVAKRVNITVADVAVGDVLEELFKDQPFSYTIVGKIIVIKKKESVYEAEKADRNELNLPEVTGVVQSENGEPLVGATIKVRGGKVVAVTDKEGSFVIHNVNSNVVLEISYTGYSTQEVRVSDRQTHFSIVLKISSSKLDEVQVIAYGTTTQRYNVGSVSKVTAEEIAEQPVSNPLQALEGRVPGLVVTQSSGIPGASIQVQIRGQNTLNPSPGSGNRVFPDNPLFIIDGVPFATQNTPINQFTSPASPSIYPGDNQYNSALGGVSPFSSINPSDIESIEVLRDADATAIYGSRGSNGVILITTKRGKSNKTKLNLTIYSGESKVTRTVPMMNTKQYLEMRREGDTNDGYPPDPNFPTFDPDFFFYDTLQYTDWKKYFLGGSTKSTDVNASLSGGTSTTQFLISGSYHRETYIFPGDFASDGASVNANMSHHSLDQHLRIGFTANYNYSQNNSPGSPSILTAFTLTPNNPELLNSDGSLKWAYNGYNNIGNPIAYLKQLYDSKNYNLLSSFQIAYEIIPGLEVRSNFGYNTYNGNEYAASPSSSLNPYKYPNPHAAAASGFGTNDFQTWIIEPQAELKKQISKGRLNVLLGGTFQQNTNRSTYLTTQGYNNDALLSSITAAAFITYASNGYSQYKYSAIFGRLNYIWNNKYIVNLTGRRDGSSRFGPGRQFGNFGSVAGGWLFAEEAWLKKKFPVISYGKLRVSYGTTGNDNVGDYQYLPNWNPLRSYQGQGAYTPANLFEPDFSWAVNKKLETGLEIGLLRDKVLLNVAWFRNRCGNQLISYPLPIQTGFSTVTKNFQALVENSGWEFQLSTTNIKSTHFSWTSAFNFTIPKNRLISFPGLANSTYASIYVVGKSTNVLHKFKYLGVNDTTGVFQFADIKGQATYNPTYFTDYQVIGDSDPKYYGGIKNTFNYRGIQLDIFIQFSKQLATNYLQQIYYTSPPGFALHNQPVILMSRWQKTGDRSDIQKFTADYGTPAQAATAYFLQSSGIYSDDFYARVKTVSLSYAFANKILRKARMASCRIFVNAQNLFTVTNYKLGDPETQSIYVLPPLKTIVAGLQMTF